jgi:hypothetical protein
LLRVWRTDYNPATVIYSDHPAIAAVGKAVTVLHG